MFLVIAFLPLFPQSGTGRGVATCSALFYLQASCGEQIRDARERERGANHRRIADLKELTDSLETLKLYGWSGWYLTPLGEAAADIASAARSAGLWITTRDLLGAGVGDAFSVIAFFAAAFLTGRKIEFHAFVLAEVYVQVIRESAKCTFEAYSKTREGAKVTEKIEAFLRLPEREPVVEGPLVVSKATFAWPAAGREDSQTVLCDIDFHPVEGELVVVSGPIGSGKSSFLLSLLGETRRTSGMANLPAGSVAYLPQVPYLCDGTIRQNIVFGEDDQNSNNGHLQRALAASQLALDMDDPLSTLHELREQTQVGRRGANVSGGQRARTALARVVYAALRGAKVALLDDPLAAVDNEAARGAWEEAVLRAMLGTTRVVVVNSQLLPRLSPDADRVVLLESGRIVYNGPPAGACPRRRLVVSGALSSGRLRRRSPHVASAATRGILGNEAAPLRHTKLNATLDVPRKAGCGAALARFLRRPAWQLGHHMELPPGGSCAASGASSFIAPCRTITPPAASCRPVPVKGLHRVGHAGAGRSDIALALNFFRRMLLWTLAAMCATFLSEATTPCAMALLSGRSDGQLKDAGVGRFSDAACFGTFAALILGRSFLAAAGGLLKQCGLAGTTFALRSDIDRKLAALSMPYFWHGGKTADVRNVVMTDLNDLEPLSGIPIGLAQNLFGLCMICHSVPLALPLVLFAGLAWRCVAFPKTWVFTQVIPLCNKQVYQRPLTIAAEERENAVVVRAMNAQARFDAVMQRTTMLLPYIRFRLWAALLFKDVLSLPIKAVFVACAMGCVLRVRAAGRDAAQAVLLYNVCWGLVKKINELNWGMDKAVERLAQFRCIDEFLQCKHEEDPAAGVDPPHGWPAEGAISFQDVAFRYFPQAPLALNRATVTIKGGEKVGVVGPTGGGKSTFLKLLLRLGPIEGASTGSGGRVLVDKVDIASLRLNKLRQAMGVVPQDPTLFRGSLQANLGGNEISSSVALAALSACGLSELAKATTLPEELSQDLSVGQKQLLAVARVIIRRPKVLILDEATASLSQSAAEQLLQVIARQCQDATVLSIAHRLRFVLHCDRVIVLQRGGTVEAFDTPARLRRDSNGYFSLQLRAEEACGGTPATAAGGG